MNLAFRTLLLAAALATLPLAAHARDQGTESDHAAATGGHGDGTMAAEPAHGEGAEAGHEGGTQEHGQAQAQGGHGEGHGQRTLSEINWVRWKKGENPPFAAVIFNFLVLVAILYFGARKSVAAFLKERRDRVMSAIDEASQLRTQAEQSHREFSGRLDRMKEEEQQIRQELLSSALREQERLVADAGARAEKMRVEARKLVDQERLDAIDGLRRDTAGRAVDVAREIFSRKIGPGEHKKLVDQYLGLLQDRVKA